MSEFSVDLEALEEQDTRLRTAAGDLESLRDDLELVRRGGADAFGVHAVAFDDCCTSWTGALAGLALGVRDLGRHGRDVAEAAEDTDREVARFVEGMGS